MNEVQIFNFKENSVRTQYASDEVWFCLKDVCDVLEIKNSNDVVSRINPKGVASIYTLTKGGNQKLTYINESNLYKVIFQSRKPQAEEFTEWVTGEVLPTIRKTGSYSLQKDSYMIEDPIERAKRWIEEQEEKKALELKNQELDKKVEELNDEVSYKEDVIISLVDGVSLSNKRDVLSRVVRRKGANYRERWSAIYREFENKYHIDLDRRLDTYNKSNKPKMRNKLDYVEKVMGKLPELYEIACKLYETDAKELVQEMYDLNGENMIAPIS